jgi:hypothetical protein
MTDLPDYFHPINLIIHRVLWLQVALNPESAAAGALRQWWDAEGSSASLTPLGQAAAGGGAGGGPRSNKLQFLSDVLVS